MLFKIGIAIGHKNITYLYGESYYTLAFGTHIKKQIFQEVKIVTFIVLNVNNNTKYYSKVLHLAGNTSRL